MHGHESLSLILPALLGGILGAVSAALFGVIYSVIRTASNKRSRSRQRLLIARIGWKGALRKALFEDDQHESELPFPQHKTAAH
jgi:hypothetical protein